MNSAIWVCGFEHGVLALRRLRVYSQVSLIPAHTLCFTQELYAFMSTQPVTQLVVDRSTANELLKINFNIRCVDGFRNQVAYGR